MEYGRIFAFPAALLVLAVVANRLSRLTRVPDIVVLLLLGVGLGPVTHSIDPDTFQHTIGTICKPGLRGEPPNRASTLMRLCRMLSPATSRKRTVLSRP